jgi:uncharacterized membrane protein
MVSGIVRDTMTKLAGNPVIGYSVVFMIEIVFLLLSLIILRRIDVNLFLQQAERQVPLVERAALADEV